MSIRIKSGDVRVVLATTPCPLSDCYGKKLAIGSPMLHENGAEAIVAALQEVEHTWYARLAPVAGHSRRMPKSPSGMSFLYNQTDLSGSQWRIK